MSGLTQDDLDLREIKVKELLDEPAIRYLKDSTILTIMAQAYDLIFYQIDINAANKIIVIDTIYNITAWRAFGAYGQSISGALALQDIGAFRANLEHYKIVAQQYASLIGIDLEDDSTPVVDDPIPVINTGNSLLNEEGLEGVDVTN